MAICEVDDAFLHCGIEKNIFLHLGGLGYHVVDIAYHHNIDSRTYYHVSRCQSTTCLAHRTRADFLVVKGQESFYLEVKGGKYSDKCFLEAYPVALHNLEAQMGVECWYVYAGGITQGHMVACLSTEIKARELVVPSRGKAIEPYLLQSFPNIPVRHRQTKAGTSGDPFLIVDKSEIEKWTPIEQIWA